MPTLPDEPGHSLVEMNSLLKSSEVSEYAQNIEAFDFAQTDMLDATAELLAAPHDHELGTILAVAAAKLVRTFSKCVDDINNNSEDCSSTRIDSVLQLIMEEADKRMVVLTKSVPCDHYDRGVLRNIIEDIYDESSPNYDIVNRELTNQFAYGLSADNDNALLYLSQTLAERGEVSKSSNQRVIHEIGKHALEVAKIVAGVAGGILIARRITK